MTKYTGASRVICDPAGFFLLRTPLLPFNQYVSVLEEVGSLTEGLGSRSEGELARLIELPAVREALVLGSSDLSDAVPIWLADPKSERGRRIESSLRRYVARMCFRPTPFGLFAGCTLGRIGRDTVMDLASLDRYRRRTRVDSNVYRNALEERAVERRAELTYWVNPTLRRSAKRFVYTKSGFGAQIRVNEVVAIAPDEPLLDVVECARHGANMEVLRTCLQGGEDVDRDDVDAYIIELISEQILVPGFGLPVTIRDSEQLVPSDMASTNQVILTEPLTRVEKDLASLDRLGVGVPTSAYHEAALQLRSWSAVKDLGRLVQVDMWKPAVCCSVGSSIVREASLAVQVLHSLYRPERNSLSQAIDTFRERFETQEVPLAQALDDESGIAFRWNETDKIPAFPDQEEQADQRLLRLYTRAVRSHESTVNLTNEDLEGCRIRHEVPLPDTILLNGNIVARSATEIDRGNFQLLVNGIHGPCAARYLGRFCDLDADFLEATRALLRIEEGFRPNAVFAEIVHDPGGRSANVVRRPRLRDYDLTYFGTSSADASQVIDASDLLVSVENRRFVLRSARLNTEIVPRMSCAHRWQVAGNLPLYQFLAALETQHVTDRLGWSWGSLLANAPWLPRVSIGRLILVRQRWRLERGDFVSRASTAKDSDFGDFRARLSQWIERNAPPEWVVLVEGDSRLPVRLGDECSERWVYDAIRKRSVVLEEMLPGPDQLCVSSAAGAFTHEFLLPLVQQAKTPTTPLHEHVARERPSVHVARRCEPGSEWLYVKLYTGRATADQILRSYVLPFWNAQSRRRSAEALFFLRYADPEFHLRIRFHGTPEQLTNDLYPSLLVFTKQLLDDGLVWKVQFDTYEREIERYGGASGLIESEKIFCTDSESVLRILHVCEDADPSQRLLIALMGAHDLFGAFGFQGPRYLEILSKLSPIGGDRHKALTDEFRNVRTSVERVLSNDSLGDVVVLERAKKILQARALAVHPAAARLKDMAEGGHLSAQLADVATSHVHMFLNRLLRNNTADEHRIYDRLARFIRSEEARRKTA